MSDRRVYDSADALAEAVAEALIERLAALQAEGREPAVALTGGTIARDIHRAVAASPARKLVDWRRVDFWFGDERYVASGSEVFFEFDYPHGSHAVEVEVIDGIATRRAGTTVTVEGGFNRPPMERTPLIADLFQRAAEVARSLDIVLSEGATGGASDGNFTAAAGLPTLDGLGCPGAGAHAEHEHVEVEALPDRAALLAALLLSL